MALCKARERDNNGTKYKKCIVKCDGDDELELFGVSEKEAAKLFSLYLFHKGRIHSIENRDNSAKVSVVSSEKEIDFLVWRGKNKLYLEACYCRLVSCRLINFGPCLKSIFLFFQKQVEIY